MFPIVPFVNTNLLFIGVQTDRMIPTHVLVSDHSSGIGSILCFCSLSSVSTELCQINHFLEMEKYTSTISYCDLTFMSILYDL